MIDERASSYIYLSVVERNKTVLLYGDFPAEEVAGISTHFEQTWLCGTVKAAMMGGEEHDHINKISVEELSQRQWDCVIIQGNSSMLVGSVVTSIVREIRNSLSSNCTIIYKLHKQPFSLRQLVELRTVGELYFPLRASEILRSSYPRLGEGRAPGRLISTIRPPAYK